MIRQLVGPEEGKKVAPILGLNAEGELRGMWREIGLPNLWYMMGNLALYRFYSKHLALRMSSIFHPVQLSPLTGSPVEIKAKQEGIFGERYTAPVELKA